MKAFTSLLLLLAFALPTFAAGDLDIDALHASDPEGAKVEVYNRGLKAYNAGDYRNAVMWFTKGADWGSDRCHIGLGMCYQGKEDFPADYDKAFYHFSVAAANDNTVAINHLGNCYIYGYGCEKNPTKAVQYFRIAADRGNSPAMTNLANQMFSGEGTECDIPGAISLLRKAIEVSPRNRLARSSLAFMYFYTLIDNTMELSADERHAHAKGILDEFDKLAIEEQDLPELELVYGICYYYLQEERCMPILRRLAADDSDVFSMSLASRCLGDVYAYAYFGESMDVREAEKWYEKAAACGDEDAAERLADLRYLFYTI